MFQISLIYLLTLNEEPIAYFICEDLFLLRFIRFQYFLNIFLLFLDVFDL
jgi:hypothetical protein